jgi:hypothetical protein
MKKIILVLLAVTAPNVKIFNFIFIFISVILISCSTRKTYFTEATRNRLESKAIPISKIQFYIDRDVELRRELSSGDAKVNSGKVLFENGKYVHIILLKKHTPGVCTKLYTGKIDVSFEIGNDKSITFSASKDGIYKIAAIDWKDQNGGKILYEGETYYIVDNGKYESTPILFVYDNNSRPNGQEAILLINKSVEEKINIEKRKMTGRKLN